MENINNDVSLEIASQATVTNSGHFIKNSSRGYPLVIRAHTSAKAEQAQTKGFPVLPTC